MTTMRDVAARAGVSAKTVSRVFNDDPHVLPEGRLRAAHGAPPPSRARACNASTNSGRNTPSTRMLYRK